MTLKDKTVCKGGETVIGTDNEGKPVEGVVVGGHYHKKKGFLHLVVQVENGSRLVANLPAENFSIKPEEEKQSIPETGPAVGA